MLESVYCPPSHSREEKIAFNPMKGHQHFCFTSSEGGCEEQEVTIPVTSSTQLVLVASLCSRKILRATLFGVGGPLCH
jgi:hypothetical protein